jgi:hypothetical protein
MIATLKFDFRDPDNGFFGDPLGYPATTCQTIMNDWIMTLAFPHVEYVKHVELIGCIKKSQKEKWERILAQKRNETAYNFDHVVALHAILATPVEDL